MTINPTTEIDAWTPEIVREQVAEYTGGRLQMSAGAVATLIGFLELEDDARAAFLEALPAFACVECGKPSCLCGYSDE